jgi:hypothetical protein
MNAAGNRDHRTVLDVLLQLLALGVGQPPLQVVQQAFARGYVDIGFILRITRAPAG